MNIILEKGCKKMEDAKKVIEEGRAVLGIELGSTRIKSVLIDEAGKPIAMGSFEWENKLVDGIWTYDLPDIMNGLQESYADLAADVQKRYGTGIENLAAIGISAMMHGYVVIDNNDGLIAPFRTWRNTNTQEAADKLTELFDFNIPLRWSIAQLYESILEHMEHVGRINYLSTLSGYIHYRLTGEKVLGIGDASGMFPIDSSICDYDQKRLDQFDALIAPEGYPWKIRDIMPKVLTAGEAAGVLTEAGVKLLDRSGKLKAGIPFCPPEGDAGTGMVATNSVAQRTGNVSAGTSIFAMIVLEKALSKMYREIDMVTTPAGDPVAMSHANNGTSELNAWVELFGECTGMFGVQADPGKLFSTLYNKALEGDPDCGGLLSYGYLSGEGMTGLEEGRPLFVRLPEAKFNMANFMRVQLYTSLGALRIGMDILMRDEHVKLDVLMGHGGFFKTKGVGQKIMADGMGVPVSVMETAGEGGAWGIALLAAYMKDKKDGETLDRYLNSRIFSGMNVSRLDPDEEGIKGFDRFMEYYKGGIGIEKEAVKDFR